MAAAIAVLAGVIAVVSAIQTGGADDFGPPPVVPRPIVIAIVLGLPAGIAAIAALRGSRAMLIAAGALCLLQSVVAFSGVTLGFVIPGIVLISLGLQRAPAEPPSLTRRREWLAGVFVVCVGIAAWVVPFATSETVCWTARAGPDGSPVYTRIPETNTFSGGPGDLGSGCDGGTWTLEGLLAGSVLAIGALAMSGFATSRRRDAARSIS